MIRGLVIGLATLSLVAGAQAQTFPSRTVTIVSPYQAGGTSDIIARILAQKLSERWGQNVVIENRPGANGTIGVNQVVRADPDGHSLLAVASSALTLNPIFYKSLSYDVARDLAPITRTGQVSNVLVVNPSVPAKDLKELVALAKQKPGELIYASQGVGSNGHLIAEQFAQRAGIDYRHVPYKGSAPAVQDLLGGRVQTHVRQSAVRPAPDSVRQSAGAGGHHRRALVAAAGCPDHRGNGLSRLRCTGLVRGADIEDGTGSDPGRTGKGDRRVAELSGRPRQAEGRRR